ncbi:MAG TPA: ATP-binding protein [Veillonellaceae bacterium]|nr:ATP-binding protein [Veillonellaceae bacterium]
MKNDDPFAKEKISNLFEATLGNPYKPARRESTVLEYKEKFGFRSLPAYLKTMASFANHSGGYIIFGVKDSPREFIGLSDKHSKLFSSIDVGKITEYLNEYFTPEIHWKMTEYRYKGKFFGIIYTYPLENPPCICKHNFDSNDSKYSLRDGDIYYRYSGRSERIHYSELHRIIEYKREREEAAWLEFTRKAAKIGVQNAFLLDLQNGRMSNGNGATIVIDEKIISKLAFIKEGHFVENYGKPALRLIGNVKGIPSPKVIEKQLTRKVNRYINAEDINVDFLTDNKSFTLDDVKMCLKSLCSSSRYNYPIYFMLLQIGMSLEEAIRIVKTVSTRNQSKKKLLSRLNGKIVKIETLKNTGTPAYHSKVGYRESWLNEKLDEGLDEKALKYCLDALLTLNNDEISRHSSYIKKYLDYIFRTEYEKMSNYTASKFRVCLCRVDEAINLPKVIREKENP